jgi:hypothetical protein
MKLPLVTRRTVPNFDGVAAAMAVILISQTIGALRLAQGHGADFYEYLC